MDEILTRLAAIEERLDRLDYVIERHQEACEAANQRRCDDLDRLRGDVRELESTLHYEVSRVREEVSRSNRRW